MATASSKEELAEVDRRVLEYFDKQNKRYMQELAHERIYQLLWKACLAAERAVVQPELEGPSRKELRMKVKEHLGVAIEWIVAMDNLDRGY